ncbi:hypothetical protein CERZMDRAFT_103660 [Cercospora zeae-maydis SCOH1-5]|uniref:Uncharacterized protein n=1 Tax=Cercospora zeae-maydis SCOH1-5 TaxID=717836 RepID=A0A6A6EXL5_9PEZI|nr:hypothetical protein CERZMDRAFT_103660 [Cercospora zeae-maydis SCOH1-5]
MSGSSAVVGGPGVSANRHGRFHEPGSHGTCMLPVRLARCLRAQSPRKNVYPHLEDKFDFIVLAKSQCLGDLPISQVQQSQAAYTPQASITRLTYPPVHLMAGR